MAAGKNPVTATLVTGEGCVRQQGKFSVLFPAWHGELITLRGAGGQCRVSGKDRQTTFTRAGGLAAEMVIPRKSNRSLGLARGPQ